MGRGTSSAAAITLSAGGPGSNLNFAINGGGNGNEISAGNGTLNGGFNFFGGTNTVAAGPGPLAFAGSIFRNGPLTPAITQTGPGIAINSDPIGGAAATSSQTSTVPRANAARLNTTSDPSDCQRGRSEHRKQEETRQTTVNAAASSTASKKKTSTATANAAASSTGSKKTRANDHRRPGE